MAQSATATATVPLRDEEADPSSEHCGCCPQIGINSICQPVEVEELTTLDGTFTKWPFFAPLLFLNESSDARDHCANERTFLSYLRLTVYMAIVSIAIVLSFNLKEPPDELELRMARPLGVIFWVLSVLCLAIGLGNYIRTVNKYSRKSAIVQSGWKTQMAMATVSISIVATCILLLAVARVRVGGEEK